MVETSPVLASPKRSRAVRAVQASGPQLMTETKFMQQYRIGAAVHGGGPRAGCTCSRSAPAATSPTSRRRATSRPSSRARR